MALLAALSVVLFFCHTIIAWSIALPAHTYPQQMVLNGMKADTSYTTQLAGCESLGVNSADKAAQNEAGRHGAIEAIASAMDLFPDDKFLVRACTLTLSSMILFNRENGLRAGQLGALNRTFHIYMTHLDDPAIASLGGAIGAYFDNVDENRAIARELGGIQALIQNIKNNFHGQYGEWNYEPVKQSLFGLSSGCWKNQDICFQEGFPQLGVSLMKEHGEEDKVAEETQQVTKALIAKSEQYRETLADLGMTDAQVHVLQVNPHDRGAIDLTCENLAWLVGPAMTTGPTMTPQPRAFNRTIQSKALDSGALEEVLNVVTSGQEMHHKEHGGFNFDIDAAYNVNKDCFRALANLGHENPETKLAMYKAGLKDVVVADLERGPTDIGEVLAARAVLEDLQM
jgi:hypothetical protein